MAVLTTSNNIAVDGINSGPDKPFKYGLFHTKGIRSRRLFVLWIDNSAEENKSRIEKYASKDTKLDEVLSLKSQRPLEILYLKDCLSVQDYSDISSEWKNSIIILGVSLCFFIKFDDQASKDDWLNVLKIQTHSLSYNQSCVIPKCIFGVEVKIVKHDWFSNRSKLFVLDFELMLHDIKLNGHLTSIPYDVINAFGDCKEYFILRLGHRSICGPTELKFKCDNENIARYLHSLVSKLMKERSRSHTIISENRNKSNDKLSPVQRSASVESGGSGKKFSAFTKRNGSMNLVRSFSSVYQSFFKLMTSDGSESKMKNFVEQMSEKGSSISDETDSMPTENSTDDLNEDISYVDPNCHYFEDVRCADKYLYCDRVDGLSNEDKTEKHENRIATAFSLINTLMNTSATTIASAVTDGICECHPEKPCWATSNKPVLKKQIFINSYRSKSDTIGMILNNESEMKKTKHLSDCVSKHATSIINMPSDLNMTAAKSSDYLTSTFEAKSSKESENTSVDFSAKEADVKSETDKCNKLMKYNADITALCCSQPSDTVVSDTVPFDI